MCCPSSIFLFVTLEGFCDLSLLSVLFFPLNPQPLLVFTQFLAQFFSVRKSLMVRDSRQPASVLPSVWCTAVGRRASCVAELSCDTRFLIPPNLQHLELQTSGEDTSIRSDSCCRLVKRLVWGCQLELPGFGTTQFKTASESVMEQGTQQVTR